MNRPLLQFTLAAAASMTAVAETTTFEEPLVSGVPTLLPVWSGFSPVVQQYGETRVQDALAGTGSQALEMSPGSAVAWSPDDLTAPSGHVLVSSFQLRLDTLSSDAPAIPSETLSAVVFANTSGLMALDGNGSGGGTWQTLQLLAADTFYTITITRDYAAQAYDVEVDGSLVADNFGFKDPVTSGPFTATFESSERTWLDDVSVAFTDLASANPPGIASLSPAGGASNVPVDTDLVLNMTEPVQKGTGSIRIKEILGNAIVANIDVASASVTVSGDVVTISLPADLDKGTAYYVEIDHGALSDLTDNAFVGIAGSAIWNFTTTTGGRIFIYEPFDYSSTGTTNADSAYLGDGNQSGALGLQGAWSQSINTVEMEVWAPGMSFTDGGGNVLPVAGNSARRSSRTGTSVLSSAVNPSVTTALTGDNTTMWMSFLYVDEGFSGPDSSVMLASQPIASGASHALSAAGYGVGILIGEPTQGLGVAAGYYLNTTAVTTSAQSTFTPNSSEGTVFLLAAKINWKPDGTPDEIFVFNITDLTTEPSEAAAIASATFDMPLAAQQTLDTLNIGETQVDGFDEIRFGSSFADVVGGASPTDSFAAYISNPIYGIAQGDQGFNQDPDGDSLVNGLEAWFGTHPGEFNAGIANLVTNGSVTTFTHPRNESPPADISGFYQWSPNLVDWYAGDGMDGPPSGPSVMFSHSTVGATTTVNATDSGDLESLFLRFGVKQN